MTEQVSVNANARAQTREDDGIHEILPDLGYQRLLIVNVMFCGNPGAGSEGWVLVDAGVMGTAGRIIDAARARFGEGSRPAAIVLTHGHFDHVGALEELAAQWDAPIYAHPLELPFLNGQASYPPPDPSVGGGLVARLSGLFPRGPVNVSRWLKPLPDDGSVPGLPNWRWFHTPGHSPGHVSLWRESDRTLIAGDAVITTDQESAYAVMFQKPELHGPPAYFTQDWERAEESAKRLAALQPEVLITGHGPPLRGPEMRSALIALAADFRRIAVPEQGRYVAEPARVGTRQAYAPPDEA